MKDWISRIPILRTYRDRDRAHQMVDHYRRRYLVLSHAAFGVLRRCDEASLAALALAVEE